jgi:hypothetical protein
MEGGREGGKEVKKGRKEGRERKKQREKERKGQREGGREERRSILEIAPMDLQFLEEVGSWIIITINGNTELHESASRSLQLPRV